MHAMTALLAFGLLNSPAPLLRTSQRSPPQRWARYPPAPVAQLVASDEDDTVRSQSSVPELPVLKPLLPESPSHPHPTLPSLPNSFQVTELTADVSGEALMRFGLLGSVAVASFGASLRRFGVFGSPA